MKKTEKENKELTELKNQIEILTNNWKRALADYQNLQRRSEKERADFVLYANGVLILKLLAALDNFEKVQRYLKDDGLDLAVKELQRILTEEGLEEISVQGKEFNPVEMEAVEAAEESLENKIEVLSKGYRLKGKVIRPVKVKVEKKL